jgi:hypothetical protein
MAPLPSLVTEIRLVTRSPLSPVMSEDAPCLAWSSTFCSVEAIPDDLLGCNGVCAWSGADVAVTVTAQLPFAPAGVCS